MTLLADQHDRRIVAMALPALGALAVEPLYVLVDTAIIGHLGTAPLAGLALASTLLVLAVVGANFLAYGTTERVANHLGAGRPDRAAGVGVQALWLSLLLGVPLALAVIVLAEPAARALGGSGEVLDVAVTYLRISAVGLPFVLVALAGNGVLRGVADLRTPLVVLVVANGVNVVLELIAVYGLDYGVAGSAWSTVIAQAGAAAAFILVMLRHLRPAPSTRPSLGEMTPLLHAGRHLLLRVGAMLSVMTAATAVAARIDDATLAAHQIVAQVLNLLSLVLDALAIPAQTLVAAALGSGAAATAMHIGRRVRRLSLLAGVIVGLVLAVVAGPLPHLFTSDGDVISRATAGLLVLAVAQLPAAVAMGLDGVLIGGGDYRFLALAALGHVAAFVPLALLTLASPSLGIVGVWLAMLSWLSARAVTNEVRFERGRWTVRR